MASQNVAGMGVLQTFGYRPALRPILLSTGGATAAGAVFGAFGVNLAAISAALVAGPRRRRGSQPPLDRRRSPRARRSDRDSASARRWLTAFVASSPPLLVESVAGLALLGTLAGALSAALADPSYREAAIVTFVVPASGMTAFGISGSFWGLLAGAGVLALYGWPAPATSGA